MDSGRAAAWLRLRGRCRRRRSARLIRSWWDGWPCRCWSLRRRPGREMFNGESWIKILEDRKVDLALVEAEPRLLAVDCRVNREHRDVINFGRIGVFLCRSEPPRLICRNFQRLAEFPFLGLLHFSISGETAKTGAQSGGCAANVIRRALRRWLVSIQPETARQKADG